MIKKLCAALAILLTLTACGEKASPVDMAPSQSDPISSSELAVSSPSPSLPLSSTPTPAETEPPADGPVALYSDSKAAKHDYEAGTVPYDWFRISIQIPNGWSKQFDDELAKLQGLQRFYVEGESGTAFLMLQHDDSRDFSPLLDPDITAQFVQGFEGGDTNGTARDIETSTLGNTGVLRFNMSGSMNGKGLEDSLLCIPTADGSLVLVSMLVQEGCSFSYYDDFTSIVNSIIIDESEPFDELTAYEQAAETLTSIYDPIEGVQAQIRAEKGMFDVKVLDIRIIFEAGYYTVDEFQGLVLDAVDNIRSATSGFEARISTLDITLKDGDGGIEWRVYNTVSDNLDEGTLTDLYNDVSGYDVAPGQIDAWLGGDAYAQKIAEANAPCTYEEYQRITDGMSYAEVVAIIGSEGVESSSSSYAGNIAKVYTWDGDKKYSNVVIEFMNDKVVAKAQAGLG